jgi:hypothetical protein
LDEISDRIETSGGWPDGLVYKFPRRDLGGFRWVALMALVLLLALVCWLVEEPVSRLVQKGLTIGGIVTFLGCTVVLVPICRYPLWYLLVLLFGHTQIEVRADSFTVGERVGGLGFTRRWPLFRIRQVQIFDVLPSSRAAAQNALAELRSGSALSDESPADEPFEEPKSPFVRHLHALTAVLDDGQRIILAPAYPKPLLESFSRELFEQMANALKQRAGAGTEGPFAPRRAALNPELTIAARQTFGSTPSAEAGGIAVAPAIGLAGLIAEAQEKIRKKAEPDVFEQPADSTVEVQSFPDGVTLRIPPAGVWKGSGGTFQIGLLFAVVTAGFTTLFAGAGIAQGQGGPGIWGAIGLMSIFWLASGGILYAGWMMGTRETVLAVVGESVMVMQTGLRRAKRREWPRSEVKTARVGASGTEINDRPVLELQLLGADDKKLFGMLSGRDTRELTWMATLLRQALKPAEPPTAEPSPSADAELPVLEFDYSGMTIEERLQVARLTENLAAAVERGDREAMLQILERVQLPPAGADAYADEVLANPRQHGY